MPDNKANRIGRPLDFYCTILPANVPHPQINVQCQACFLSSRKTANGAQSADEGEVGGGHLASHDVTQIMGKPTVLGR